MTPSLLEIRQIQNQLQVELFLLGDQTFVPMTSTCKEQTAVSRSSTEAGVRSLDTGLRMGGQNALALWNIAIDVIENLASRAKGDFSRQLKPRTSQNKQESIDYIPPNAPESSNQVNSFICQDTEELRAGARTCVTCHERIVYSWVGFMR